MSFIEWFLEPANPGPIGKLGLNSPESDDDDDKPPRKWLIWLAVVVGLILFGVGLFWAFQDLSHRAALPIISRLCYLALYILIGHLITAKPNYTNVGWVGGLIDNPFRISDDYNRWLVFIKAILLPGKLIAYSLIMSWHLSKHLYNKLNK
ncbi:hypothetical protein GBK04_29250 [Cytophagaceae bacterium SJW1-29]|uniref:Uncharacterized protein n=1 Tax=Salmonirosea aquatica TaxID=2654236 RepID=A0A7C9F6G4_9BACT|nr:hypothetical protein [Cytophagaceae bacterium SJW1-29]